MGLFLPGRRASNRRFDYEPRYYDPKKEQDLKRRMQVGRRAKRRRSPMGIVYAGILLVGALYFYFRLGGV
jgi:hypothetical protein